MVEGHTAVLLAPYLDKSDISGTPIWEEGEFEEKIQELDKAGFQIDVHAIGDRAVQMCLDAYEKARQNNGQRDSRHKISHVQLVSEEDQARFIDLGVIAAIQPNCGFIDTNSYNLSVFYLGQERADKMYTLKGLIDAGAVVSFGSDWPVGSDDITMNPLDGIQTAVTRLPFTHPTDGTPVYRPDERISLRSAIEAATISSAYASFMENETGSLEVEKLADLIILDRDLFALPPEEINKVNVLSTYLEGYEVYNLSQSETN